jgi:hypothetical protein
MAVTVTPYNHTASRLLSGATDSSSTLKINLYSALTFDATHTTRAQVDAAATPLPNANGYTHNTKDIDNLVVSIVSTNGAMLDADDVEWNATPGALTAAFAMVFDDDDVNKAPLFVIDFDGSKTADPETPLKILWNANGILRLTVV